MALPQLRPAKSSESMLKTPSRQVHYRPDAAVVVRGHRAGAIRLPGSSLLKLCRVIDSLVNGYC